MSARATGRSPHGYNWDAPWLECRRKWAWENIWKLRSMDGAVPYVFGLAAHAGLEAWYFPTDDDPATRELVAVQTALERWHREAAPYENVLAYEQEQTLLLESLLRGYFQRYPVESWKIVGRPEHEFEVCLSCGRGREAHPGDCVDWNPYTGKIDLLVEYSGRVLIVEHKTSGLDAASFHRVYHLSDQITGYIWAAKQLFPDVAGAIVNGLGKGRYAKTLHRGSHWYSREIHERQPRDLDRWLHMRRAIRAEREEVIKQWERLGRPGPAEDRVFYMNTEACYNWGRACQYLDACLYHGDEHILANYYRSTEERSEG